MVAPRMVTRVRPDDLTTNSGRRQRPFDRNGHDVFRRVCSWGHWLEGPPNWVGMLTVDHSLLGAVPRLADMIHTFLCTQLAPDSTWCSNRGNASSIPRLTELRQTRKEEVPATVAFVRTTGGVGSRRGL